jgi:hypothetical protein
MKLLSLLHCLRDLWKAFTVVEETQSPLGSILLFMLRRKVVEYFLKEVPAGKS